VRRFIPFFYLKRSIVEVKAISGDGNGIRAGRLRNVHGQGIKTVKEHFIFVVFIIFCDDVIGESRIG
jgi:hypothetical protein